MKLALILFISFLQTSELVGSQVPQNIAAPNCSDLFQSRVEVLIQEEAGKVVFNFFAQQGCGANYKVVPDERVSSIIVTNIYREEVWKLEVADVAAPRVSTVTYGIVPKGFVQAVPKLGKPPRLERNEEYYVAVLGQGRGAAAFVYRGVGTHSVRN